MFDNLIKELDKLSKTQTISVPLEADSEGYVDKECPAEKCLFNFKIHGDDWSAIVRDEQVFCPNCKHEAPANSWFTTAQVDGAKEYAFASIGNSINKAMRADAAASKRRQKRNAFFSITLETKGGKDAVLVPVEAADPMRLKTVCEECNCRYSFIGAAYFCPSCGTNSASHTFSQTMNIIRMSVGLEETLNTTLSADDSKQLINTLIEKAVLDTVTSFQRFNEQLYEKYYGKTTKRNAFQNLDAGTKLWKKELGISFDQLLESSEMDKIRRYFQQRHLLAHQQGIVDLDYITRSGDTDYALGQRLVIKKLDALEFSELTEKLALNLLGRLET